MLEDRRWLLALSPADTGAVHHCGGTGKALVLCPHPARVCFQISACAAGAVLITLRSGGARATDRQHRARCPVLRRLGHTSAVGGRTGCHPAPSLPGPIWTSTVPVCSLLWDQGPQGSVPTSRTPLGVSCFLLWSHLCSHWTVAAGDSPQCHRVSHDHLSDASVGRAGAPCRLTDRFISKSPLVSGTNPGRRCRH